MITYNKLSLKRIMIKDKNISKRMVIDLCKSSDFEDFKTALKEFNSGIEDLDMAKVVDCLISLGNIKDKMMVKLNAGLELRVEKYLSDEQNRNIEMESVDGKVYLVYKKYVPSYKKGNQIVSISNKLIEVDFVEQRITMLDVEREYLEATVCHNKEIESKRIELDLIKCEIEEMEEKRNSRIYVMSKIGGIDGVNKDSIANGVKLLINKDSYYKNLSKFDDLIIELKEDLNVKQIDYKKNLKINYESDLIDARELQKGLMRRLIKMNFKMDYENPGQDMKLKPSMLGAFNLYNKM